MQDVDLQDKLCLRRIWGRWVGGTRLLFSAGHQPPTRLSPLGASGGASSLGGVDHCSGFLRVLLCIHTGIRVHTHRCTGTREAASLARRLLSQQPPPCHVLRWA